MRSPSSGQTMTARPVLRVGLLGAGTVGREVARAFLEEGNRLTMAGAARLELTAVAIRDLTRPPSGVSTAILIDAPAHVVADPAIDVIVELMGGDEPARTLIAAALGAGKAVVTANKHVLAHHGAELEAAARRTGGALRFEGAVGGGIPVLTPLAAQLSAGRVTRIRGIVNGTTNYILNEMASAGRDYADVLADAQAAGYAEADPTADVEGLDAANKLVILIRLAFGFWPDPETIVRRPWTSTGNGRAGITGVSATELSAASALGLAIKLIVDARRLDDGTISASVQPTAVPLADPIARISGVTNRIEIRARPLGSVAFSGPGAGGPATSSAVLGDLRAVARGAGSTWAGLEPAITPPPALAAPVEEAPDRGWFAFVPGRLRQPLDEERASTAVIGGGTAVHARCGSLAEMRSLLAGSFPAGPEVTIYPTDEEVVRR